MNNFRFRRFLSGVLALVMMTSTFTMVNVVSVSAATANFTLGSISGKTVSTAAESDLYADSSSKKCTVKDEAGRFDKTWIANGTKNNITNDEYMDITINSSTFTSKNSGNMFTISGYNPYGGNIGPKVDAENNFVITLKTAGKLYIDYACNSSGKNGTIFYKSNEPGAVEQKAYLGLPSNNKSANGIQTFFDAPAGTYTLKKDESLGSSGTIDNIYVYAVGFISNSGTTYTIKGNCTGLTKGQTFTLTDNTAPEKPVTYTATVDEGDKTYTVTKKAESAPFGANTKLTASLSGYKVNNGDTAEVTLSGSGETFNATPALAFESNQYSVTLKVVNSDDSTDISNANAYKKSAKGTAIPINKNGTEIKLNKGTTETFYVGAPNFLGAATEEVSEANNGKVITVKLDPMPKSGSITGGNYFSTQLFYPETPKEGAAAAYNFKDLSNYTANGFTFSKFTVQMFDSSESSAARLNIAKKQTIKYKPTEDGTLTIIGASGSNKDKTRGYNISPEPVDGNPSVVYDGEPSTDWVTKTHQLKEGIEYTITVKDVDAINIQKISFEPSNTYDVTINADNKTEDSVTINVGSQQFTAKPSTTTTSEGLKLTEGKHTLSAKGYTITPNVIDVQSSGVNSFDVTIEKSTAVTVKFSLVDKVSDIEGESAADAGENIKIEQLDATNAVVKTENLKTIAKPVEFTDIDAGTKFRFSSSARNVVRWLTVRNGVVDTEKDGDYSYKWKDDIGFFNGDGGNNRYFIYTVPNKETISTTGTDGVYGIEFTAVDKVSSMTVLRNNNSYGDHIQDLNFAQYGFGKDKAVLCGNDARNFTSYRFEYAGLGDYHMGYCADIYNTVLKEDNGKAAKVQTTNEFGILNAEGEGRHTHVVFKVGNEVKAEDGGPVQVIIDRTGAVDLYEVEVDPEDANGSGYKTVGSALQEINNGIDNKEVFEVTAGKMYGIRARETGAAVECYVKSIRIYNPNNILDSENYTESNKNVKKLTDDEISALNDAGIELSASSGEKIFRIIGTIALDEKDAASESAAKSFLQTIDSVGFDAYKESDYKIYDDLTKTLSGYHFTGRDSLKEQNQQEFDAASVEVNTITFADIVNTAVDFDDDREVDLGELNPSTFSKLFVQTFYATNENMVLIPWVKYVGSDDKVYSLISIGVEGNNGKLDTTNNVYLNVED